MGKRSLRVILGVSLCMATMSACKNTNDAATPIGGETDKQVKTLMLQQKWVSPCNKTGTLLTIFQIPSQTEKYDMGSSLQHTTTLSNDANCATPLITITENGSYKVGDKVSDNVYALTLTYDSVAIMPMTPDGAQKLNDIKACGFGDWAAGASKDVTAQSSADFVTARCWIKTPRVIYDISEIDGDHIKFGLIQNGQDKSSVDKRPTAIDQSVVFSKQ